MTSGRCRQPTNSAYTVNAANAAAAAATANGSTVAYACACACQTVLPRPLLYCILIVQKYAVSRLPVDHRRRGKRDFFLAGVEERVFPTNVSCTYRLYVYTAR